MPTCLIYIIAAILLLTGWPMAIAEETGMLRFTVVDGDSDEPLPAKLVFLRDGKEVEPGVGKTATICAEANGFYSVGGQGEVAIAAGTYDVYAARGMEYSIARNTVTVVAGQTVSAVWKIRREIDPAGFVGCDFHLHTSNSDGKPTPAERVISLAGEGVEFAVATDHNLITDLAPEVERLRLTRWLKTCPGDEVSGEAGHFCVFPLAAADKPLAYNKTAELPACFAEIAALPQRHILQVNHPRTDGLGYFGHARLHPVSGEPQRPQLFTAFTALEIMNQAGGWGMFTGLLARLSVWEDWFNLLNQDIRPTAVGNTDSHRTIKEPPGLPRNYVLCPANHTGEIKAEQIVDSLLRHEVTVARGVFVDLIADSRHRVGAQMIAREGKVELCVRALAPSWVKVERVTIYGNGRVVWQDTLENYSGPLRYEKKVTMPVSIDTWYVAKAEGSQGMGPCTPRTLLGPVTPVGFTNPIWVDADGGGFVCERERVRRSMASLDGSREAVLALARHSDGIAQKQLYALLAPSPDVETELMKIFAFSDHQPLRLFAYEKLAQGDAGDSLPVLQKARELVHEQDENGILDMYLIKLSDGPGKIAKIRELAAGNDLNLRWRQMQILSTGRYLRHWHVIGPFANDGRAGLDTVYAPEIKVDLEAQEIGKDDRRVGWQSLHAMANGYVDLMQPFPRFDNSLAYAFASIHARERMETVLLFGSDDGAAIWHNGKRIYALQKSRRPTPGEEIIAVTLQPGENTFLVKVENGGGGSGFYFELYDPYRKLSLPD